MENYESMLDDVYSKAKKPDRGERFEIPIVKGLVEGTKTIVTNFSQICSVLRRNCDHVTKFLSKELATQIVLDGERAIFNRKLTSARINEKIEEYAKEFVLCKECGKPDTELLKEKDFMFLHCLACGAKHSVRAKI